MWIQIRPHILQGLIWVQTVCKGDKQNTPIGEQGSHRLEKYLNLQDCLEKSLKIKFVLKSSLKALKGLEKSLNFTIYRRI